MLNSLYNIRFGKQRKGNFEFVQPTTDYGIASGQTSNGSSGNSSSGTKWWWDGAISVVGSLSSMFGSIFSGSGNKSDNKQENGINIPGGDEKEAAKKDTGMYIIVAVVSVALIVGLIWFIKRKK
jgi:cobalamin biosynthesis Mg chelatase CobN